MNDVSLRYSCQMLLPDFGSEKQTKLKQAKVLIAGAGGLGCPAAQYLTAAGIGTIGIADYDIISIINLHRQILYTPEDVGFQKADIACARLKKQNPDVTLVSITQKLTRTNITTIIGKYDIVIDCTDNFDSKYLLNDACVLQHKPLVFGAIYQYEGQLSVFNNLNEDGTFSPNYRDLFNKVNADEIPSCTESGVMPTIAGIIGCMQANEVIKYLTGASGLLAGMLLTIDARTLQSRIIKTGHVSKIMINGLPVSSSGDSICVSNLKNYAIPYHLIDVRDVAERNAFHIGGIHMPLIELERGVDSLPHDATCIFYCESGSRSKKAVRIAKMKFPDRHFLSLDGGLRAWKHETHSLHKI